MQSIRLIMLAPVLFGLAGCSYLFGDEGEFRERSMDYKKASSIESLAVPVGMESKERKQRYPIPSLGQGDYYVPKDSDDLPKPQALLNVNEDAGVELRGKDDHHWLVVNQSRERIWPQVAEFLNSNGLVVDQENVAQGYQETRWLKPRAQEEEEKGFWSGVWDFFSWGDDDERERFRLTFTDMAEQGSTVIEINHIRSSKGEDSLPAASEINWPEEPEDPDLVLVMYNELLDFLGEGGRQVSFSVLSQDLTALPKFVMTWDGNGYPVLVINQDFNRAWQDVGTGLKKARMEVEDLDRSLGIYYLKKTDPVDAEERPLQLRIARSESGIQVSVQYDDDNLASKETSAAVLNRLREAME